MPSELNDDMLKILVVDDQDVILSALTNFFEEFHFAVEVARDGLDGLLRCVEYKPDLIFLDILMPNLDGINMLKIKKDVSEIRDIPVIIITGNTNKDNILAAIETGAVKVISKPLQKKQLIKTMREVLGDDMFSKPQRKKELTKEDKEKLKRDLVKKFLVQFITQKKRMLRAIKNRDKQSLDRVMHQLKGAGGTIGRDDITEMSAEIETKNIKDSFDWLFVEKKCREMIDKISKMTLDG